MQVKLKKTCLYIEFGGYYEETDKSFEWNSKDCDVFGIVIPKPVEEVTYDILVDAICRKIGVDRATHKLLISYVPMTMTTIKQTYISDDMAVDCYLSASVDNCRNALRVEKVGVELIRVERVEKRSSFGLNYGENLSEAEKTQEEVVVAEKTQEEVVVGDQTWVKQTQEEQTQEEQTQEEQTQEEQTHQHVGELVVVEQTTEDLTREDMAVVAVVDQTMEDQTREEVAQEEQEEQEGEALRDMDIVDYLELPSEEAVNENLTEWEDGMGLSIGQKVTCKEVVQELVLKASHRHRFDVNLKNSDTWRYVVGCKATGCNWYLRVTRSEDHEDDDPWFVSTYRNMHSCSRVCATSTRNKKQGTPEVVAGYLRDTFPGQMVTPPARSLITVIQKALSVSCSYSTVLRGKSLAASFVRGDSDECYRSLPSYLYMVEQANPGSKTAYMLDKGKFMYCFVALGPCIEGFQAMRKVIMVDATFLRNGGNLVIATAQDPEKHHYPIAFGVIDNEKDLSWGWFISELKTVVPDSPELVILSDRNGSLIKAVAKHYPMAEHGYCVYHLAQNVRGAAAIHHKKQVSAEFMLLANIYNEAEFCDAYAKFRHRYPAVAIYLDKSVDVSKWARCYFPGARYNLDKTNPAESLNNVFRQARTYSILPMFDAIITKISEWFNKHRKSANVVSAKKMVPRIEALLHEHCTAAEKLKVTVLNSFGLEYSVLGEDGKAYLVDLRIKSCTCKQFDFDKYPCVHAVAGIDEYMRMPERLCDLNAYDFCSVYYMLENWAKAYQRTVYPVPHASDWIVPEDIRAQQPMPPGYAIHRVGRKREKRFKSPAEGNGKRRKSSNTGETSTTGETSNTGGPRKKGRKRKSSNTAGTSTPETMAPPASGPLPGYGFYSQQTPPPPTSGPVPGYGFYSRYLNCSS